MNKQEAIKQRRLEALHNKSLTFSGKYCEKCGTTKRYTSNKKCFTCAKIRARDKAKQTMEEKELGCMAFVSDHKGKVQYSRWI